jgi:hypothetical protein
MEVSSSNAGQEVSWWPDGSSTFSPLFLLANSDGLMELRICVAFDIQLVV